MGGGGGTVGGATPPFPPPPLSDADLVPRVATVRVGDIADEIDQRAWAGGGEGAGAEG